MLCVLNNCDNSNYNCNCDSCCEKKAIESLIRDAALWKKKRDRAVRATRLTHFSLNKGFLKNLLTRNENFNDRLKTHSKALQENVNQDQPSTSKDDTSKTDYEKSIRLSKKKKTRSRSSSSEIDSTSSDDDTATSSDSSIEVIIKRKRKRKKHRKTKHARKSISPSSSPTYEDLKKSFYCKYFKIPKESSSSKGNKKQMKQSVTKKADKTNLEVCTQENNSNQNKIFDQLNSKDPIEIIAEDEPAGQSNELSLKKGSIKNLSELPLKKGSTKSPNTKDKLLLKTCNKNENLESKHTAVMCLENKLNKSSLKSHKDSSMNDDKKVKKASQKTNNLYSGDEDDEIFLKIVPLPEKSKKGHDQAKDDSKNVFNKNETEEIRVEASEITEGNGLKGKHQSLSMFSLKTASEINEGKDLKSKHQSSSMFLLKTAPEINEGKDLKNKHQSSEKIINTVNQGDAIKAEMLNKNDLNTFVESLSVDKVDKSVETGQSKISFSLNSKVNKTVDKPTEFQQQELENSDQSERRKSSSGLKKRHKKSKKKGKKVKRKGRSPESNKAINKIGEKDRSRSHVKDKYSHRRHTSSSYDDTPKSKSTSRRRSYSKSPSRYYSSSSSKSRYRSYSRSRSISDRSYRSYSRSSRRSRSRSRRKYSSSRYSYSSMDRRSSSYRDSRSRSRHRSRSRSTTKSRSRRSISFSYVYTNPEKARKYYKRSVSSSSSDSDRSRRKYKD